MTWQLAEAKNRFSEVVRMALSQGPQQISRRGEKVFVVSEHDYRRLNNTGPDFKQFLLQPLFDEVKL